MHRLLRMLLLCILRVSSSVVEQWPFKPLAVGSIPTSPTMHFLEYRGPFVYRLGRRPLTAERGVRFPYGLPAVKLYGAFGK